MTATFPSQIPPVHPGKFFREHILPSTKLETSEVAALVGISPFTLYDFLDEKVPITASMALRLGKLCGNAPEAWLYLQVQYDLWQARKVVNVDKIPTLSSMRSP
jgi:addiction module HigA family antidote